MMEKLEDVLVKEQTAHQSFFGRKFNLLDFRVTLGRYGLEKVQQWQELGLEPHFLPAVAMFQDASFPGWKVKPEEWYYKQIARGKILRRQPNGSFVAEKEVGLEGITVLIDTRLKPRYEEGRQMFKNDNLLGRIIESLRKDGKIARYKDGPQSSRFGVSPEKWEKYVKPSLAGALGVEASWVRFERAIEANVIPQLYPHMPRHRDGQTGSWQWYEEFFEGVSYRLSGGSSSCGGLADVSFCRVSNNWNDRALRPLIVLGD